MPNTTNDLKIVSNKKIKNEISQKNKLENAHASFFKKEPISKLVEDLSEELRYDYSIASGYNNMKN